MRASGIFALVATTAAFAAGCGGGGGSSGSAGSAGSSTTTSKAAPAQATSGKAIFTSVGCSTCHTLADAGAKGQVGPNLDDLKPSSAAVAKQVTKGGGGMPAFAGQLSSAQIKAVADYVAKAAG